MPEVEYYRRLAQSVVGRTVRKVKAPDPWYLKGGLDQRTLARALRGRTLSAARRRGKLLLLDTDGGPTLGLRFGMTGRLLVDGTAGVEHLVYSSPRQEAGWDRLRLDLDGDGTVLLSDPRRLGGVELDPDESRLGPDVASVGVADLRRALGDSAAPLKARLLDQSRLAGVGNLVADEVLWRAGLDPGRPAGGLRPAETRRLHRHLRATIDDLLERGGSHMGDLFTERRPGGHCPRDGEPLDRVVVGGRTTWWCPRHQR